MKCLLAVCSVAQLWRCCTQQMLGFGKCPEKLKLVDSFDMSQYIGVWYEQYRYFTGSQIGHTCSRVNYTHTAEGPLKFSAINYDKWKEKYVANTGVVKIEGPEQSKLLIEFPQRENVPVMHWILDTDYKSYAVVWSCENGHLGFHHKSVWIYTRDQHPSKDVITEAINALRNNHILSKFLIKTDQLNCCNCNVEEELPRKPNRPEERSREETYDEVDIDVEEIENV